MSDAWWDQRIAEWQGARKYKTKVPPNMDVFEAEFGAVTVTGAEGWCAQQGETSLHSRVDAEKDDESDSVDTEMPAPREGQVELEVQKESVRNLIKSLMF
ncbi:uncharacterized protein LOC106451270 isoform X2 [Brassica napus]|nr:uncharacterized protein LOC106451270 isoform X2 [Brassica napus]XP_048600718.1 uncharacterized protein LOC106451270 isoform X2 [Brassica napus]